MYRPQFFVRTADVTGSVQLPEGTEMVMPGDTVSLTIDVSRRRLSTGCSHHVLVAAAYHTKCAVCE